MSAVTVPRAVLEQALEAMDKATRFMSDSDYVKLNQAITTLRAALPCTYKCEAWPECACAALAQEEQEPEPVAWTDRELQLINGMIEVQLHHAAQCDGIANRTMAEKQKGWDMERVALLQKIKSNPPRREPEQEPKAWMLTDDSGMRFVSVDRPHPDFVPLYTAPPRREWRSLTNEEIYPLYNEPRSDAEILEFARAVEQALKEKNHE
jgi:hypothetical protein